MGIYRDYIESRLVYLQENKKDIKNDKQPWDIADIKEVLLSMVKNNPMAKETALTLSTAIDIAKTGAITTEVKERLLNIRFPLDEQMLAQKLFEICTLYRDLLKTHQKEVMDVLEQNQTLNASEKIEYLHNANRSYVSNLIISQGITMSRDLVCFLQEINSIYDQQETSLQQTFDDNLCVKIANALSLENGEWSAEDSTNNFLNIVGEAKFREYLNRILTEEQFKTMLDENIIDLISRAEFDTQATIDSVIDVINEKGNKEVKEGIPDFDRQIEKSLRANLVQALTAEQKKEQTAPQNQTGGIINILFSAMSNRSFKKGIRSEIANQQSVDTTVLNSNSNTSLLFENVTHSRKAQTRQKDAVQAAPPPHRGKRHS